MNKSQLKPFRLTLAVVGILTLLFAEIAGAQTYYTTSDGYLVAGFRKTGSFAENYELVANLGNITNFLKLSIGTTINITNVSRTQITNMCPDNLANLQWSVFSTIQVHGFPDKGWITPVGTFPPATLWYTVPRTDVNTQTTPPARDTSSRQALTKSSINGVNSGATSISQSLSTTNQYNNILLVREPVTYSSDILTAHIGDKFDSTIGDFAGTLTFSVENTTPSPFSSPARSDLYQVCSTGAADPSTGTSNGMAYLVGYFTLNTDGNMTFTRAITSTVSPPPPAPVLTIAGSITANGVGGSQVTSTISFNTTNGATYTLYYTNSAGLNTAITNWPSLGGTITGDGSMHSFTNSSADPSRFFSVGAH